LEQQVNDYTHYALIRIGHAVLGVGKTVAEARNDAHQALDSPEKAEETVPLNSAVAGDLAIVHCTSELAVEVRSHGGDLLYEHDGIDYIRLPEQPWVHR
jgi:hypothetical protein